MKKTYFLIAAFLITFSCAGLERSLPPSCGNYKIDISQELNLWDSPSLVGNVFHVSSTQSKNQLPIGKKIEMPLKPQESVEFPILPEKSFIDSANSFAGLSSLSVLKSGIYRIFASDRIWFDVIESTSNKLLSSQGHHMDKECPMRKAVLFFLEEDKSYILQISSSVKDKAFILITQD